MSITLQQFNVWYNQQQIFKNINYEFHENIITAIIGHSGCGKTTLLKSLNRTAELSSGFKYTGQIFYNNTQLYDQADAANIRREIGMVLQKPIVLPMSIQENVVFGPRYYGIKTKTELAAITEECLIKVGLWNEVKDKLNHIAYELSGGQQQRLSIARLLAVRPKILLLDEPCSSLDIKSTRIIENLLQELNSQLTIIIVTHNLAQAKRIAQQTIFMSEGQIIEANNTAALFSTPQEQQTIEFLADI